MNEKNKNIKQVSDKSVTRLFLCEFFVSNPHWKKNNWLENSFIYHFECAAQKMKFSIKDFFSKFDQIRSFLRIWSHLLKKSSMENFIYYAGFVYCWLKTYLKLLLNIRSIFCPDKSGVEIEQGLPPFPELYPWSVHMLLSPAILAIKKKHVSDKSVIRQFFREFFVFNPHRKKNLVRNFFQLLWSARKNVTNVFSFISMQRRI